MKTLAPGTGSPCVLTTRPTRSGPGGENAGVLGGNAASGVRVGTPGPGVFAVLEPGGCCAAPPKHIAPNIRVVSKQTGTSKAHQGLASALTDLSLSNMTIIEN